MRYDILIIGGGPIGLGFARMMAPTGCKIGIVEKQPAEKLAAAPDDGREVAITHRAHGLLARYGILPHIPEKEIHLLRAAEVINQGSPSSLHFNPEDSDKDNIGFVISNYLIRRAAYKAVQDCDNIELVEGTVSALDLGRDAATVTLDGGKKLSARLVVAADSRFSTLRDMAGIKTDKLDFKRLCIVCRITHEKSHRHIASECFLNGLTLASIPLADHTSSLVLTMTQDKGERVLALDDAALAEKVNGWTDLRLGRVKVVGKRHAYPLVGVYARRFSAARFALLGDAAVGMHPVSAHGFNFGIYGAQTLAEIVTGALLNGLDIGSPLLLQDYTARHRMTTRPFYEATNAIVRLYTNDRPLAKLARKGVLTAGRILTPARKVLVKTLTREDKAS